MCGVHVYVALKLCLNGEQKGYVLFVFSVWQGEWGSCISALALQYVYAWNFHRGKVLADVSYPTREFSW